MTQPRGPGFYLTYLRRELQRRMRQAILIALGLAVGVGLVITVTASTAGVRNAQGAVLQSLYGIGTDMTVTADPVGMKGPDQGRALLTGDLGLIRSSSVSAISRLRSVAQAAGGLLLTELAQPPSATIMRVAGVGLARLGPFAAGAIISGRRFTAADATANVAVVDAGYAAAGKITVGSRITIAHTAFTVIGIIRGDSADVYIPLDRAQGLAGLADRVDIIYVSAASAADVAAVQAEISRLLPAATVASSASLAGAVRGTLTSAANLAGDLGRWVAVIALIAACALASLLTIGAVARRVREIGTLRALGWRSRRIVAQVIGESMVTGAFGALSGLALGFGGVALVDAIAPELTATTGQPGSPGVAVRLAAHVSAGSIMWAVLLAMGCALVAGSLGAWRAARLQPAEAFNEVA